MEYSYIAPQTNLGYNYRRKYLTSPEGSGLSYGLMYGATSPAGNDVIDRMIKKQLSESGTNRLKGEMIRQQQEAEQLRQQQIQQQQDMELQQQQIAAATQAGKTGLSLASRGGEQAKTGIAQNNVRAGAEMQNQTQKPPVAQDLGEFGGGATRAVDNTSALQEAMAEKANDVVSQISSSSAQRDALQSQLSKAIDDKDEDLVKKLAAQYNTLGEGEASLLNRFKSEMSAALPVMSSGYGLYSDLSGALKDPSFKNITSSAVDAGNLTGSALQYAGEKFGAPAAQSLGQGMGNVAGTVGAALGLGKGLYDIYKDPSNQAAYTNLGVGAVNAAAMLAPTATAAGTTAAGATAAGTTAGAASTIGSAASAAAPPLLVLTAAEMLRNAYGGVGKTYDQQSAKQVPFNTPVSGVLAPFARTGDSSQSYYNYGKMISGGERVVMAPINWLFGDNTAFDGKAFDDLISGFKGIFGR